ncbi:MAG: biopolymer transporter ExbD [Zoogloeaceae bacterium]|nr:biopolymer transporter ExbD [Zoogloeaceae bacterium]
MDFRRRKKHDDPEINLVAMIDVLLVLIIFLMLTTTYAKFSGAKIDLPTAESSAAPSKPESVEIGIAISGTIFVNAEALADSRIETIARALKSSAGNNTDAIIVINADAKAAHQSVVDVMQAAQSAGFARISFSTQTGVR